MKAVYEGLEFEDWCWEEGNNEGELAKLEFEVEPLKGAGGIDDEFEVAALKGGGGEEFETFKLDNEPLKTGGGGEFDRFLEFVDPLEFKDEDEKKL